MPSILYLEVPRCRLNDFFNALFSDVNLYLVHSKGLVLKELKPGPGIYTAKTRHTAKIMSRFKASARH